MLSASRQKNSMKKIYLLLIPLVSLLFLGQGCTNADVVSQNLSKEADYFKVFRRIVFYNGINGDYILEIKGYCALGNYDSAKELTVTCKTGDDSYKKHFLGLSDNVTFFAEQIDSANVSADQYEVIFKPSVIIPDIRIK